MRKSRLRAVAAALVAILACVGLTFAAGVTAQATPSEPGARVALGLDSVQPTLENVYIMNEEGTWCLDGRLGVGNVKMEPCGSDGTHQIWTRVIYPGYDYYINEFNDECLDGRLGNGNTTLTGCGTDGQHQMWLRVTFTSGNILAIYSIHNLFNGFCLDNRPLVTVQECDPDGTYDDGYELWFYAEVQ